MVEDLSKKKIDIVQTIGEPLIEEEEEEEDMFQRLLNVQDDMQYNYYPNVYDMSVEKQLLINTRAMIHETIEVEREVNWKHWKKDTPVDIEKIKNEIVDQFIFLMNEINAVEMDYSELFYKTFEKIDINIERQKSGY